jgi:uncharacterized RDD family membrane protein YckC
VKCGQCSTEQLPGSLRCRVCGHDLAVPVPSVVPAAPAADTAAGPPLAGPWSRYWARTLDLTLWTFLLAVIFGLLVPRWLDTPADMSERVHTQLLGLVFLPAAMLGDALTYAIFGGTPGRRLAGLTVRDSGGRKLSPPIYLRRNLGVYVNGMALGLGLIGLIALIHQYRVVSGGRLTSWDGRCDARVSRVRGGLPRTAVTAVITVLLSVGGFGLGAYMESPEHQLQWMAFVANVFSPTDQDPNLRFERVRAAPGLVLGYDFRVLPEARDTQHMLRSAGQREQLHRRLAESMCADFADLLSQNGRLRFHYADTHEVTLADIEVTRADCAAAL